MIKLFESNKSILIKNNFQFVSYSMSDYNAKECLLIPYSRPCGIYRASFGQRSSPVWPDLAKISPFRQNLKKAFNISWLTI